MDFYETDTTVSTEMFTYFSCEYSMLTIADNLHEEIHVFLHLYWI